MSPPPATVLVLVLVLVLLLLLLLVLLLLVLVLLLRRVLLRRFVPASCVVMFLRHTCRHCCLWARMWMAQRTIRTIEDGDGIGGTEEFVSENGLF